MSLRQRVPAWKLTAVFLGTTLLAQMALAQDPPSAPPPPPADPPNAAEGAPSPQAVPTSPPPAAAQAPLTPAYAYPPGYDYRHDRRWRRPRRSRALMISGFVVFGVSYLIPAFTGIAVARSDGCDCNDGYRMLIPVAGPLTLLHRSRDYELFNITLVADTVLQSAGLVLSIIGIIRFIATAPNDDYGARMRDSPGLSFTAMPTPGGAYAALRWRL